MAVALEQRVGDQGLNEAVLRERQVSARHRHRPRDSRFIRAFGGMCRGRAGREPGQKLAKRSERTEPEAKPDDHVQERHRDQEAAVS